MAPVYRLTLFLLTCITYWGGIPNPSWTAIAPLEIPRSATGQRTEPSPLGYSALSWEMAQEQGEQQKNKENTDKKNTDKKNSQKKSKNALSRLPWKFLVLGLGALIVTLGAILILIRLMSPPADEEGEIVEIEAEEVKEPSPIVTNSPQPPKIESSEPMRMVTPPSVPTIIQENPPPITPPVTTYFEKNGYREVENQTPKPSPTVPPATFNSEVTDPPRPKELSSHSEVTDAPRSNVSPLYPLDPQQQWLQDLKNRNRDLRSNAIWELAQEGDSRAIQPLLELMINSDSNQRSLILAALSEIGTRTLKPLNRALSLSLQDENTEVRKNAIRDLTRIYDLITQMSQILQRATDDPDPEVRETAQWAINKFSRLRPVSNQEEKMNQ